MAGERHCAECGAPLASDQTYCLECGRAADARRLERLRPAPAAEPAASASRPAGMLPGLHGLIPAGVPLPGRMAATLACALGVGVIAGAAVGPTSAVSLAARPPIQIVVQLPPRAPAPAPAPAPVDTTPVDTSAGQTVAAAPAPPSPPASPTPTPTPAPTPPAPTTTTPAPAAPHVANVFVVVLQDRSFDDLFGAPSQATYLKSLVPSGVLLDHYYAVDRGGLPNYVAMTSGQEPNAQTQADCPTYDDTCVYAKDVSALPNQLVASSLTWKGYIEGMDRGKPGATCRHPDPGQSDPTNVPGGDQGYATRHDPFVYFHAIVDQPSCAQHDVPLTKLDDDLKTASTTPTFSLIVPDLTNGHDKADEFLKGLIPKLQKSDAYANGALIVITSDRTPPPDPNAPPPDPATPPPPPDPNDPGGGRVGALLLSKSLTGGSTDETPYTHYSLLRTIEDLLKLDPLGKAKDAKPFVALAPKPAPKK
jgi:hypothetical protein